MFAEIWNALGISGWITDLIEAFIIFGFLKEVFDWVSAIRGGEE